MKKIIAIFVACAFILGAGAVIGNEITGNATITAGGNAPVIDSIDIYDDVIGQWPDALDPNHEYQLWVNVSDADTIDNIATVDVDIFLHTFGTQTISKYRYTFDYAETTTDNDDIAGTFTETNPTDFASINLVNSEAPDTLDFNEVSVLTYIFAFTFDEVAVENPDWDIVVTVTDAEANTDTVTLTTAFGINPYITMDFDTGGASHDFDWTGVSGGQYAQAFNSTVTSNDGYTLGAKFTGWFEHTTLPAAPLPGDRYTFDPNLEVGTIPATAQALPNATAPNPDVYVDFHTSADVTFLDDVQSWNLYLTLPANTPQGDYVGVTVYILATNS